MASPKVTIGVVSYNHVNFLPAAIESALSQTFEDFEIVIVDDGSTDGSLAVAQDFAEKHSNVRLFTHPHHVNKGISATCNLAVEKSRGEYIALLGSDDAFYPYTIEEQTKFLDAHPEVGMVCGIAQFMNENGDLMPQTLGEDIWSQPDYLDTMIGANKISAPTVMVRRSCYEEVGLFVEEVEYNDYEMWLRIMMFSDWKIGFINKPLALYRVHSENVSLNNSAKVNYSRNLNALLYLERKLHEKKRKLNASTHNLIEKGIAVATLDMFCFSAEEGKLSDAIHYLSRYIKRNPKEVLRPRRFASISYRMAQGFTRAILHLNTNG